MGQRVEWANARYLTAQVVPALSSIGEDFIGHGSIGVVFGYDEVFVIEGDRERLLTMFRQVVQDMENTRWWDPVPADFLAEDESIGGPM